MTDGLTCSTHRKAETRYEIFIWLKE